MSQFGEIAKYLRESLKQDLLTDLHEISEFAGYSLDRTEVLIKNRALPAFHFGTFYAKNNLHCMYGGV